MGLFPPAGLSSLPGYFGPSFWGHLGRAGRTTLQAAFAAQGHRGRVFAFVGFGGERLVFDLAGEDIPYELAELGGIAGTWEALF
jgi:hypothetical protein